MQQETLSPSSAKAYYLDGEYWRSALYVVVGVVIIGIVSQFMMQMQGRGVADRITSVVVLSGLFVFSLSLLFPRLRVDANGIHRRLFFWYWDSWLWEEFRSGAIREGTYLNSYRGPSRPFWCRKLVLEVYPAEARDAIEKVLKQFTLKPQIEIPESIAFKLYSEQWEFREAGITLQKRRTTRNYAWEDIESVSVAKLTHEHQSFRNLEVKFADKTTTLRVTSYKGQRIENWKGAQAEEILAFVMKQVPEDRIEVTARNGPPLSKTEAARRLETINQNIRERKKIRLTANMISASLPLLWFLDPNVKFLIMLCFQALFFCCVMTWMMHEQIQQLETQRAEIDDWLTSEGHSETLNAT